MSFQQNVQQNLWYIPLVVAAMSFLGTLTASLLTRKTEHQKWLRHERLVAYARFLAGANAFIAAHIKLSGRSDLEVDQVSETFSVMAELGTASALTMLLGTKVVQEAATSLMTFLTAHVIGSEVTDAYQLAYIRGRDSFIEAVRVELGLDQDKSLGFPLDPPPGAANPDKQG